MIFVLGDIHFPYAHWPSILKVVEEINLAKRQGHDVVVVQIGDLKDQKFWSRFPKDGEVDSGQLEFDRAEQDMIRLHKFIPNMHIIFGNHDRRIALRAADAQLPKQLVKTLDQYFDFPGWIWHANTDPLIIDDIAFMHGDETTYSGPGQFATKMSRSVVYGHTHQMKLDYVSLFDKKIFGLNVGWLGDMQYSAFNYSRRNPSRYTLGYGVIIDGVPFLIPL
jgi:predicted phosphodiesterase